MELPGELYVGQGYGKVSWAVRTIWETYMGWFLIYRTQEEMSRLSADISDDEISVCRTYTLATPDIVYLDLRRRRSGRFVRPAFSPATAVA